jgi:hypothetical protein
LVANLNSVDVLELRVEWIVVDYMGCESPWKDLEEEEDSGLRKLQLLYLAEFPSHVNSALLVSHIWQ